MSAGKRARVPAALHNELTEYSSLLRALRTSNTLDLASQLTTFASVASASQHDQEDEPDVEPIADDGESERQSEESISPSRGSVELPKSHTGTSIGSPRKPGKAASNKERDTWTRWPLLAGDVNVPEWNLEDEVKSVALQCLAATGGNEQLAHQASSVDDSSDLEDITESQLTSHAVNAITESTSRHLSQILALLAAYVPPNEKSMQNRVRPLNWESVLNIVIAHGLASPEYVCSCNVLLIAQQSRL